MVKPASSFARRGEILSDLLELRQVIAGLVGAIIALLGQLATRQVRRARTAKGLCVAFWEELKAVNFYGPTNQPNFAGFSSQTFDSMFRELAESLPEDLARVLMRYHWRMKYMEEMKPVTMRSFGGVDPRFWAEAKKEHSRLLERLEHYSERWWVSVVCYPAETCDKALRQ